MTNNERTELERLVGALRERAYPVGSMSALWDVVFDMEAYLRDRPTIVSKTAPEWIKYAKECLD